MEQLTWVAHRFLTVFFVFVLCHKPRFSSRVCCFKAAVAWPKMGTNPVTKEFPISLLSMVTLLEIIQNLKEKVKTNLLAASLPSP